MTLALKPKWWIFPLLGAAAAWACSDRSYRLGSSAGPESDPTGTSGRGGTGGTTGSAAAGGVGGNIAITGGAAGSGNGAGCDATCDSVSFTAYVRPPRANVILAVDTTNIPAEMLASIELALNRFAQSLASNWIDPRVVVLARQQPPGLCVPAPLGSGACVPQGADSLPPTLFHHPSAVVDGSNALEVLIGEHPVYSPQLDRTAPSTIIVVTGGDAAAPWSNSAAFVQAYSALTAREWWMYAYHPFFPCQGISGEGAGYRDVAELTAGALLDICTVTVQPAFEAFAGLLLDRLLACTIPFPQGALDPRFVTLDIRTPEARQPLFRVLSFDDCEGQTGGWYFDDPVNPRSVVLCPQSCSAMRSTRDAAIDIVVGCPSIPPSGCN